MKNVSHFMIRIRKSIHQWRSWNKFMNEKIPFPVRSKDWVIDSVLQRTESVSQLCVFVAFSSLHFDSWAPLCAMRMCSGRWEMNQNFVLSSIPSHPSPHSKLSPHTPHPQSVAASASPHSGRKEQTVLTQVKLRGQRGGRRHTGWIESSPMHYSTTIMIYKVQPIRPYGF